MLIICLAICPLTLHSRWFMSNSWIWSKWIACGYLLLSSLTRHHSRSVGSFLSTCERMNHFSNRVGSRVNLSLQMLSQTARPTWGDLHAKQCFEKRRVLLHPGGCTFGQTHKHYMHRHDASMSSVFDVMMWWNSVAWLFGIIHTWVLLQIMH